ELRIRACHVYGSFTARDNARPPFSLKDALENPVRDTNRIVLPPAGYRHEREKIEKRWPAAVRFIEQHKLNEVFNGEAGDIGIVMQGGMYNTALRALEILGLADVFGESRVPLYVLNVTYPLIESELIRFCADKKAILIIEEGQPEFIEQAVNTILRRADVATRVEGKGMLPMAGEYTGGVVKECLRRFIAARRPDLLSDGRPPIVLPSPSDRLAKAQRTVAGQVHGRPPSFCTGCPERPIFTAMKLVERELGPHHVSCDIGCHLFSVLPPFNVGNSTMGYGLGGAGVKWVRTLTRTYDVAKMRDVLKEALTTAVKGPKIIVAQSECMLNKERRVRPLMRKRLQGGERVVRERFGVDADTCTGDHSC